MKKIIMIIIACLVLPACASARDADPSRFPNNPPVLAPQSDAQPFYSGSINTMGNQEGEVLESGRDGKNADGVSAKPDSPGLNAVQTIFSGRFSAEDPSFRFWAFLLLMFLVFFLAAYLVIRKSGND